MKNTGLVLCLLLFVASCSTNRYELTDRGNDKLLLQKRIDESASTGMISKTPMLVIDGKPFRYDVELKKHKLKLSHGDIARIDILKMETAVNIYGEMGKKGVILISTVKLNRGFIPDNNMLILSGGKKISMEEMKKINPLDIESIVIVKTKSEIQKYTSEECEGVIVINLKKKGSEI